MSLDDLDPPTLRLMASCIQWKIRHGWLWITTVWQLSGFEPGSDAEAVIRVLGLEC